MLDVRDLRQDWRERFRVLDAVWVLESIPGGMSRCPLRQEVGVTLDSTLLITPLNANTRLVHCPVCFIYDGLCGPCSSARQVLEQPRQVKGPTSFNRAFPPAFNALRHYHIPF